MIQLTHRAFRQRRGSGLADLAFTLPGGLASNAVALVSLVGVFILMAFNPDYRTSVAVMPIWLFILFAAYEVKKRSSQPGRPSERMQEARR